MQNIETLRQHSFINLLIADASIISKGRSFKISDTHLPKDFELTEWEYVIHNTGFYTFSLLHLCNQLNSAYEFISNYDYKKPSSTSKRIEHLEYNIENYIIRIASVKDRTLQVVNAAFHFAIDEGDVSERIILQNLKVKRTKIPSLFIKLKKNISKYAGDRNAIIHRHAYLSTEIRKLHILYGDYIFAGIVENKLDKSVYKDFRRQRLKNYLKEKKQEISVINDGIFISLLDIFTEVEKCYNRTKRLLE